jgi:hypothetical protein
MDTINLKNNKNETLIIKDVMCNTPECQIMMEEDDMSFPVKIQPGESINFKVIMTAESFGSFDAIVYIVFETRVLLMFFEKSVEANKFGLRPIYFDRLLHR